MRRLGVMIDSEHFTDLYRTVFSENEDARKVMTKLVNDKSFSLTEQTPEGRFIFEMDEDCWTVGQVFEVDNKPYALVKYHAYDGVDFELLGQFDSYKEAKAVRDKDIRELIDGWSDPYNKVPEYDRYELFNDEDQSVWDDGQEWHIWSIINLD